MTRSQFIARFTELYADVREVGGSITLEKGTGTPSGDAGAAGAQLAAELWERFDADTNEYLLVRIGQYVGDARSCREAQRNAMTRDPEHAKCRPIVNISEHGSPEYEMRR